MHFDDNAALIAAFERGSLAPAALDDGGQLRLAFAYLQRDGLTMGGPRFHQALKAYAMGADQAEKYHATVTEALLLGLDRLMLAHPEDGIDEVLKAQPELVRDRAAWLSRYYSPALLESDTARATVVAPDRQALAPSAETYDFWAGDSPLLLSMPHNGTGLPGDIAATLQEHARLVPDTDWFMDRLYDFAKGRGISVISPRNSRYVIDLNRAPDGVVLYAGANNTELCPTTSFDCLPLYRDDCLPDETEVTRRIVRYWQPYHRALEQELARLKARHGYALLFDAHSIASAVPRFFEGRLPDLNLGSADGQSCSPALQARLCAVVNDAAPFSAAVNGRFKGGYITRHYGRPETGVEAVQLELSQATYLDEASRSWNEGKAAAIKPVLVRLMDALLAYRP